MTRHPANRPLPAARRGEQGLQIALRLISVLRMGRAYAIEHAAFKNQLEQLLDALAPVLGADGEVRLVHVDGDLHLNELALPIRAASVRFTEQLVHEMRVRSIAGVRFTRGLAMPELERFMAFFLPSETWKGLDLERACAGDGIVHAVPLLWAQLETCDDGAAPQEAPRAYGDALDAWSRAAHDARWLMGSGLQPGIASHRYHRIVQPIVDAALANDALSAGLADLDHAEVAHWTQGLRVCLLTVLVGRALGLDRVALAEMGVAALIHGTDGIDPAADDDPVSATLLRRTRLVPFDPPALAALRAALPVRHEADGTDAALPAADVLRIAYTYVSLATRRENDVPLCTPHDALGTVLGPLALRFHPALRAALVQAVGVYPPGQIVELDDGSVARVSAAGTNDPRRPLLEPLTGPAATDPGAAGRGVVSPLPEGRRIVRAVPFTRPGSAGSASAA